MSEKVEFECPYCRGDTKEEDDGTFVCVNVKCSAKVVVWEQWRIDQLREIARLIGGNWSGSPFDGRDIRDWIKATIEGRDIREDLKDLDW